MKKILLIPFFVTVLCFWGLNLINAQEDLEVTAGESISDDFLQPIAVFNETLEGEVVEVVREEIESYDETQNIIFQDLQVLIKRGSIKGQLIEVSFNQTITEGQPKIAAGDRLLINMSTDETGGQTFYIIDFIRLPALMHLFLIFIVLVLLIGQWHGVRAFAGLLSSFVIIFAVILPGLQQGLDPILVAITGAVLIICVTFYLSHGFNEKTTWAIMGTVLALMATGLLAHIFINEAKLSGFGAEEVAFLQVLKSGDLNVRGLLLAGIIIGALGVLDDITISQVSIVKELKLANPKFNSYELFVKAMNVGKDHIASLVNTLILVYTGASLPLLLLFTIDNSRSPLDVLNYEMISEQVINTLLGSIGLVLAVPITTALVAWFGFKNLKSIKSKSDTIHHHKH